MEPGDADRLLRWYPEPWRRRYGDEMLAMVDADLGGNRPDRRLRWSLMVSGVRERTRHSWLIGPDAGPDQRVRGGSTLVLWAWALLVPAGLSFAKFIEHWQASVPTSERTLPALAVGAAQVLAVIGGLAVVTVAAIVAPALARSLRQGAWPRLRRTTVVAGALATAWLALSIAVVTWAHRLTPAQRNGGSHAYNAMAIGWGGLTILTLAAFTAVAIRAERQVEPGPVTVRAEAAAAIVVTAVTTLVTAAVITWWVSMASTAPSFLHGFTAPPGLVPAPLSADRSAWNWRLAITALDMIGATGLAAAGTIRVLRGRHGNGLPGAGLAMSHRP
jgi:hypothetical protein